MRSMAVLGIGASLIAASACVSALTMTAFDSTRGFRSNTAAPPEARPCYAWQMPDYAIVIISRLPHAGWPLLSAIDCTEFFSGVTTTDIMDAAG